MRIISFMRKVRRAKLLAAVAVSFLVGISAGIGLFYLPNTAKPAWMPRDIQYDLGYAWSYMESHFHPSIPVSGQPVQDGEAVQFNATLAAMQADQGGMTQSYVAFAPQHGISLSTEWTMDITVVSDTGPATVGTLTVTWNGYTMTVSPRLAPGPGQHYGVVVRYSSGIALLNDFQSGNFLKGSLDFMTDLASGNLKWSS